VRVPRLLLAGAPGSGKTTLVCRLAERLRAEGVVVSGFVTREVREDGHRVGFTAEAEGRSPVLIAHVAWAEGPRVGRYRVDVTAFERVALPALRQALHGDGVAIIDELGQMELLSPAVIEAVERLFGREVPVVATVHLKAHPVTDAFKQRRDVELIDVGAATQDVLLARLTRRLLAAGAGRRAGPHQAP